MNEGQPTSHKCAVCHEPFTHPFQPDGGRPPLFCQEHRHKKQSRARSAPSAPQPPNITKQLRKEAKGPSLPQQRYYDAAKLARRLSRISDPRQAADAAGLSPTDEELADLVRLADTMHAGLKSDDPGAIGQLMGDVIVDLTADLRMRAEMIPPSMLGGAVRQLSQVRETYVGTGKTNDFTEITLVLVGPDGSPITLHDDKAAKIGDAE